MKKGSIAIIGGKKAYLPQRFIYQSYLGANGFEVHLFDSKAAYKKRTREYHIIWTFIGFDRLRLQTDQIRIHEYQTIPVDKSILIRWLKTKVKVTLNKVPHLRIYKNNAVKNHYGYNDQVPFIYRDVGLQNTFFKKEASKKSYDFVYLGEVDESRELDKMLTIFINRFQDYSLLIIGDDSNTLARSYKQYANLKFTGRVPQARVAELLGSCKYGLHYIPNRYPFNKQLSFKLIEYCASGLQIISTQQDYLDTFQKDTKGRFFVLDDDLSNFHPSNILNFEFKKANVDAYEWEKVLQKSKILETLQKLTYA